MKNTHTIAHTTAQIRIVADSQADAERLGRRGRVGRWTESEEKG